MVSGEGGMDGGWGGMGVGWGWREADLEYGLDEEDGELVVWVEEE